MSAETQEVKQETNITTKRIHKLYPPLPDCPILMLSDDEKKARVKQFQNYFRYRLTNFSTAPYYTNPDDLQLMIDAYFDSVEPVTIRAKGGDFKYYPYAIAELALFCGFNSRSAFFELGQDQTYANVVKNARAKMEGHIEKAMQNGISVAGNIFWLKNHGWIDKTEQNINQTIREIKINVPDQGAADLINQV